MSISHHLKRSNLQVEVAIWQRETFGANQTIHGVMNHLKKEMVELWDAVENGEIEEIKKEAADVLILLFGIADRSDFDLLEAVQAKLAINKRRTWGAPDAQSVIEHVEEGR